MVVQGKRATQPATGGKSLRYPHEMYIMNFMSPKKSFSIFMMFCLLVLGCGDILQYQPIEICGLVIRNQTNTPLHDVKLKVEKTGAVVTCNMILAEGNFSTDFPLKSYQGNSVRVSWQQNGRAYTTGDLYAEMPDVLDINSPAAAIVEIHHTGVAAVRLEQ